MKIGILYVCTGNYSIFWKYFYESAESLLLPGSDKHYFVFTDARQIEYEQNENVHKIYQEKLQFPLPTLLRFHMFLGAEQQLKEMDYLFFFNANMKIASKINADELLPDADKDEGLVVALHSGYYKADSRRFPYEKNKKSTAFFEKGRYYFQGCFSGGTRDAYLRMSRELKKNIQIDLDRDNFIAVWWDESHLNKYMRDKHPKILSPAYCYPEDKQLEFAPKILMLDKSKLGGHRFLRGQKEGWLKKTRRLLKKMIK